MQHSDGWTRKKKKKGEGNAKGSETSPILRVDEETVTHADPKCAGGNEATMPVGKTSLTCSLPGPFPFRSYRVQTVRMDRKVGLAERQTGWERPARVRVKKSSLFPLAIGSPKGTLSRSV